MMIQVGGPIPTSIDEYETVIPDSRIIVTTQEELDILKNHEQYYDVSFAEDFKYYNQVGYLGSSCVIFIEVRP